jgi:hypothetical protein
MGFGDLVGEVWDAGKKATGEVIDSAAHVVGSGLDAVGLDGAAHAVDQWGDRTADSLGADIAELELGQSEDPKQLIHGDAAAIRQSVGHLRKFHAAFDSTGSGLSRLDSEHWQGKAAEAFRAKFAPHPKQWLTASAACEKAAGALETYAHTVEWAQGRAKECIDRYRKASDAYDSAKNAYNKQVDTYNAQVKSYNQAVSAGRDAGTAPVKPGQFQGDSHLTQMNLAEMYLHQARVQRDSAAKTAGEALRAATATAPAEPGFATRLLDDASDLATGAQVGADHFTGGLVKGGADLLKFARGLNPEDPYNLTHPAMYLDHINTTVAGMLHASNHPTELVSALAGSGWGSDPAEAFGKLVTNLAAGVLTDGGSVEASVAERESVGIMENAAKGEAENAAEHGVANSGQALPDGWTIDPTTADNEAAHDWKHLAQSTDHVSAKAIHNDVADAETRLKFENDQYPWLKDVNGQGPGYDINCSQNVEAVNGRLDGHDSTAAPLASEKWPDKATLGNPNADWEDVGSYDKVIEDMDKRGEGSRGVVYISRPNGTAHVFNVIHDRNGVVFLDGQSGHLGQLEKNVSHVLYMPYK